MVKCTFFTNIMCVVSSILLDYLKLYIQIISLYSSHRDKVFTDGEQDKIIVNNTQVRGITVCRCWCHSVKIIPTQYVRLIVSFVCLFACHI